MEWIEIFKAIILGIIEGITEWLPVSSTGHMILVDEFIKLDFSDQKQKKLYDEVVLKTRKIYALNKQMMSHPDKASINILEKEKNRIIVDIQELIGKVYRQEI